MATSSATKAWRGAIESLQLLAPAGGWRSWQRISWQLSVPASWRGQLWRLPAPGVALFFNTFSCIFWPNGGGWRWPASWLAQLGEKRSAFSHQRWRQLSVSLCGQLMAGNGVAKMACQSAQ